MASTLATVMVNQPVSILRREPRARILRHAHSHHRSLSAVSSALANVTPPGSPDRTCSTEEEEAHVQWMDLFFDLLFVGVAYLGANHKHVHDAVAALDPPSVWRLRDLLQYLAPTDGSVPEAPELRKLSKHLSKTLRRLSSELDDE